MKNKKHSHLKIKTLLVLIFVSQFSISFSSANTENTSDINSFRNKKVSLFVSKDNVSLELAPYYKLILERNKIWEIPTGINSNGLNSEKKLSDFLIQHNKKLNRVETLKLAQIYISEAHAEGINHDIAFSQMCLETGFLTFNGSVLADQYNFCGLGAVNQNKCGDKFKDMQEGVRAHIQHLKAYANHDPLNNDLVDARFKYVKRGSANNINDLTGKWATDKTYGQKISNLLERLYTIK